MRITEALEISLPELHLVDVGAMAEGEDRYAGLVAQGLARVTGFEPDPAQFARLAARPGPYRYLPHCLGAGGPATMHVTRYPGCTSLYEPDPAVIDLFTSIGAGDPGGNFHVLRKVSVETRRLDDVAELGAPDYLKVDVQGAELDVLRHGTQALASTLVLECEVEFLPLYRGQPLFADIAAFLATQGFVLHKLIDLSGRCFRPVTLASSPQAPLSQLLWADGVFVRDFTRLDRFGDVDLLKAATLLHEVYLSYDLAAYFLREHDRRRGSDLQHRYLTRALRQDNLPTLFANVKTRF